MRRIEYIAGIFALLVTTGAFAQEPITVDRVFVCTGIIDREPTGVDSTFADSTSSLYCFTELNGPAGQVIHAWYHGDKLMFEKALNKGSDGRWRTWSQKNIIKDWSGDWRVDIKDTAGNVLKNISFKLGN